MNTIERVNAYGKDYKEMNGTYFNVNTPDRVIEILENARRNDQRIRVFYGDSTTGRDWLEEHDVIGTIGRSSGNVTIPILLSKISSNAGGAILTDCIVKITRDKQTIYEHPEYHIGRLEIKPAKIEGYSSGVYRDGENIANFKTEEKAMKYVNFIEGKVNRK